MLLELACTALTAPVVAPSADRLAALEAKVRRAVAHGRAEATLRAYASDWGDFAAWCHTAGLDALPATAGTVAGHVSELIGQPESLLLTSQSRLGPDPADLLRR